MAKATGTNSTDVTVEAGHVEAVAIDGAAGLVGQRLVREETDNRRFLREDLRPYVAPFAGASNRRIKRNAIFLRVPWRIYKSKDFTVTLAGQARQEFCMTPTKVFGTLKEVLGFDLDASYVRTNSLGIVLKPKNERAETIGYDCVTYEVWTEEGVKGWEKYQIVPWMEK